jgi:hypothetical protein
MKHPRVSVMICLVQWRDSNHRSWDYESSGLPLFSLHHETQNNDIFRNDIQNNDTQHNDIQNNDTQNNEKGGESERGFTRVQAHYKN